MKKYFLVILIFIYSCDSENVSKLEYTASNYSIPIGAKAINNFVNFEIKRYNDTTFLFYYDWMLKSITKIDFSHQKLVSNIPIIQDKYEIKGVNQLIRNDTCFVLRNLDNISYVDKNGLIIRKKKIPSLVADKNGKVRFKGASNSRQLMGDNELVFTVAGDKTNYQDKYMDNLYFLKYSTADHRTEGVPIQFNFNIEDNHSFLFRSNPLVLQLDEKAIINFAFTPDIYEFDLKNMSINNSLKFEEFEKNKPVPLNEFDFEDAFKISEIDYQPYYHPVVYDKYRDKYYRFIRYPNQNDPNSGEFKLDLVVMDSEFDLIGKVDLGKDYLPYLFVTKDGLYIRIRDQRESYIDLHKLNIQY